MTDRLKSLDALRGLVVAAMILVLHPGNWDAIYRPLQHATWHGWTPADSIFPFFLFVVGTSTVLATDRRLAQGAAPVALTVRALRRGVALVTLGLFLAGLGDHVLPPADPVRPIAFLLVWGAALWGVRRRPGVARDLIATGLWAAFGAYFASGDDVRAAGVLQRIGVCSFVAACICLWVPRHRIAWITLGLLLGYWALLTLVPVPGFGPGSVDDEYGNLASYVDRALLDGRLWSNGLRDPEGPLSTLGALATTLLGVGAGRVLRDPADPADRVVRLFVTGAVFVLLGCAWHWLLPLNKSLWTSSFAVFTAGQASCALALCLWLVDLRGHRGLAAPAITFGANALVVFVGSGILLPATCTVEVAPDVSLRDWLHAHLFATWLPPRLASLAYAGAWVVAWYLVLRVMQRRGWTLRV